MVKLRDLSIPSFLCVGLSLFALLSRYFINPFPLFLLCAAALTFAFLRVNNPVKITRTFSLILLLALVLFLNILVFVLHAHPEHALVYFLAALLLARSFALPELENYAQLMALSVISLLAAGAFTSIDHFPLILMLYILLGSYWVMKYHLASEYFTHLRTSAQPAFVVIVPPTSHSWLGPFFRTTLVTFSIALLIFSLIPKHAPSLTLLAELGVRTASATGFSSQMGLGEMTKILEDPTPVLRVKYLPSQTQTRYSGELFLRGIVYGDYAKKGNSWQWLPAFSQKSKVLTTSTLADASIIQPPISDNKQHYLWRISYEQPLSNLFVIDRPLALAMNQQVSVEYKWNNNILTSNAQSLVSGTVYQLLTEQVPNLAKADSPEPGSATTKKANIKHSRKRNHKRTTTRATQFAVIRPWATSQPATQKAQPAEDSISPELLNVEVVQGYPMFSQRTDDEVVHVSFNKFKPIAEKHAGSPSLPPIERVQKLENWLKSDFTYSLDNTDVDRSKEPLMDFLVRRKHGHCEYFASALVALTRSLGFDSRVVGGFKGGEYNSFGEYYVVRNLDAHAWTEVWIEDQGWVRFDPTPAGRDQRIRQQDSKLFKWFWDFVDLMQYNWTDKITSYDGSNRNEFMNSLNKQMADPNSHIEEDPWTLKHAWKWLVNLIRGRNYKSVWVQVLHFIIAIGVLVLLGFLFRIFIDVFMIMWTTIKQFVRRRWENRFGRLWYCPVDFYRKLLIWLASRGMTRHGTETADEFVDRVSLVRPDMEKVLRFVTKVYLAIRFGEKSINAKQRQYLIDQVESVETTIATTRLVSREIAVPDDDAKKVRKRVQDEKDPQLTNKDFDFRG
jgi:hypothetical protein